MTDIMVETVDFIQRRESSAVKQALQAVKALHDALALKRDTPSRLGRDQTGSL